MDAPSASTLHRVKANVPTHRALLVGSQTPRACVANSLHQPIIMSTPVEKEIDNALSELETVADQIRVKIHLAGMDANDVWNKTLEPRLLTARKHACEAKAASKAAIASTLDAFREFQKSL